MILTAEQIRDLAATLPTITEDSTLEDFDRWRDAYVKLEESHLELLAKA